MAILKELDDYILVNAVLAFLIVNFSLEIGTIYVAFSLIDWFAYYIALKERPFSVIPIEKQPNKRFESLVWAMGIYVMFIFLVNMITQQFTVTGFTGGVIERVSQLIAQTFSATPILAGSNFLKLMVFGVLIPIVETRFFFRTLMQWAVHSARLRIPSSVFSVQAFGIMAFFGAIFAVFHIVAKGITNNSSLLVTFVFGMVSVGMVIHFKEISQAIFLHIITNSIAMMQQLGIGFFEFGGFNIQAGLITIAWILGISWFLMYQTIPLVNKVRL